jgi:transcriptional regulator with XRE-family HTH domain
MIDELNKRIIEVMVRTEHSKSSFATALGVSLPLITHITTGRNKPGMDIIQKLLTHFEQISPDWLLLGNGEMYRQQAKQADFTPVIAQLNELFRDIESIKESQQSVVQYHKILFDEIKHLAEMDVLIGKDADKLTGISGKLERIKQELLSNV